MTVKELITELRQLPLNDEVLVQNSQNNDPGFYKITDVRPIIRHDGSYVLIGSNYIKKLP